MDKHEKTWRGLTSEEKGEIAGVIHNLKLWKEKVQKWLEDNVDMTKQKSDTQDKATVRVHKLAEKTVDSFFEHLLKHRKGSCFTPTIMGTAYTVKETIEVLGIELRWIKKTCPEKAYSSMHTLVKDFTNLFKSFLNKAQQYGYQGGVICIDNAIKEGD